MPITYTCFGAAQEVTGSKHLFTLDGNCDLLFDCGAFQGKRQESYERNQKLPFDPATLDDVVLSHAHFDHCGNLPTLVKRGYKGNMYATPATRDITNLVLMDSAHIQAKDAEFIREKRPGMTPMEPLYEVKDVLETLNRFVTINYDRDFHLSGGVTARFLNSGHILGSAMTLLTFPAQNGGAPIKVLYSGDLGRRNMPIIADPSPIPTDIDFMVCESTYGNRLHDPIDNALDQLAEVITSTYEKGGKVIIPAFAVERTQELIYFLHLLTDQDRIPKLDIFVDSPMAVNATSIFRVHQECYNERVYDQFLEHHKNPFGFAEVEYITDVNDSKELNTRQMPCVIIASSGMCEGGRILHHLKNNITNPANTILVVGYMGANTLGRRIADREPEVRIFGKTYPLRARVKILNTFSAHADYQDICDYLAPVNKETLKAVLLVHGEDDAINGLRGHLQGVGVKNIIIPTQGEKIRLW